jgi:hypothetical protein
MAHKTSARLLWKDVIISQKIAHPGALLHFCKTTKVALALTCDREQLRSLQVTVRVHLYDAQISALAAVTCADIAALFLLRLLLCY